MLEKSLQPFRFLKSEILAHCIIMMYCNTFPDLQEKLLNSNHSNLISAVEAGWCQCLAERLNPEKTDRERKTHTRQGVCAQI